MSAPVIRIIDIETSPNLGHVWGLFKQNIGLSQLIADDHIMSYSYKDLGNPKVVYEDCRHCFKQKTGKEKREYKKFVKGLRNMLDESDIVIAHNGKRFDVPWINGQCALQRLKPPSPFRQIDTLLESRKAFRFPSFKLEYLIKRFGLGEKLKHKKFIGHALWMECLQGNEEAWEEMKEYNINDVVILESFYLTVRPYFKGTPNLGVFLAEGEKTVCPACGGDHIHYRGYYQTNLGKYRKFQCQAKGCGAWGRDRTSVLTKAQRAVLGTNTA